MTKRTPTIEKYKARINEDMDKISFKRTAKNILMDGKLSWETKGVFLCILHTDIPKLTNDGDVLLYSLMDYSELDKLGTIWRAMQELTLAGYGDFMSERFVYLCVKPNSGPGPSKPAEAYP